MLRRSLQRALQQGVHVPAGSKTGARMKQWPDQEIPAGFSFTSEQRFRLQPIPRDTGRIPRNFVLGVLYRQQPAPIDGLWESCRTASGNVLDSRRHLREVLRQARDEGFVYFEKDAASGEWQCLLTRERYQEVASMVQQAAEAHMIDEPTLRGEALSATEASAASFEAMSLPEKEDHLRRLKEQVSATSDRLRTYSRNEMDYLPYTDLNGRVHFMWWYEAKDGTQPPKRVPAFNTNAALPV